MQVEFKLVVVEWESFILDNNSPAGMGGYELCDLEQMT